MKKVLALILVLAMAFGLVACGGNGQDDSAANNGTPASDGGSTAGEPYAVQLYLPTMMTIPAEEDVQVVEDAINDYILNTLGITDYCAPPPNLQRPFL